jgi:hypothetical protein
VPWKFDPFKESIVWVKPVIFTTDIGDIDMGGVDDSLIIDLGSRNDSSSQIDQGMRVYDGDI